VSFAMLITRSKEIFHEFSGKFRQPDGGALWLGFAYCTQNGDRNTSPAMALQLRKLFPDSRETQMYCW